MFTLLQIQELVSRLDDPTCPAPEGAPSFQHAGCGTCNSIAKGRMDKDPEDPIWWLSSVMFLCAECGNKRCPKASWHGYECSKSNEVNQAPAGEPPATQVLQQHHREIINTLLGMIG